jgi:hypothetical protein
MRFPLSASLLVSITTCSFYGGPSRAEVLPAPFPGTVLTARAIGGECGSDGCQFDYKVRITNPTDRDADVQECSLAEPRDMQLPVTGPAAGVAILAHTERTMTGRFFLPIPKDVAKDLVGQEVSCTGLDWHADPPV